MRSPILTTPWLSAPNLEIFPQLYEIKRTDPEDVKKNAALQRIREVNAETTIYTDGSAFAGIFEGGSAVVITEGDPLALFITSNGKVHHSHALMRKKLML